MRKTIKKNSYWVTISVGNLFPFFASALTLENPLGSIDSFAAFGAAILRAVVIVAIPLTVLFFIWGGLLFVTAQGNPQQIEKAKKAFFWTFIGGMVIVAAWAAAIAINNSIREF